MDLEKRYTDAFNSNQKVDILHMVRRYPEWAANRIQVGERALAMLNDSQRKMAESGKIEDIPAKESPTDCPKCGGKEFHREISQCRDYLVCEKCKSVRDYHEALEQYTKKQILCHFCNKCVTWERPINPLKMFPLPQGWTQFSPALGGWLCCETCNELIKRGENVR